MNCERLETIALKESHFLPEHFHLDRWQVMVLNKDDIGI